VFNHFNNELFLLEHLQENEVSNLEKIQEIINNRSVTQFKFSLQNDEDSNFTNDDFLEAIKKGQEHCFVGDVFQIVLSRKHKQAFKGDEFNVYRPFQPHHHPP
jgi:anthranilate synthase component 1